MIKNCTTHLHGPSEQEGDHREGDGVARTHGGQRFVEGLRRRRVHLVAENLERVDQVAELGPVRWRVSTQQRRLVRQLLVQILRHGHVRQQHQLLDHP